MFSLLKHRPAHEERAMARRHEPFWTLREEMENVFDRFLEGWNFPEEWTEMRDWEMEETEKEVVMRLELPGFEAREIELRVEGNNFVARAEHAATKEEKNGPRHTERREYRFVMPFGTNANRVEATYRNGVLELHLPRLPEAQPRRIEVKT